MQLFMDGLVLYIHVCSWDTLMVNPTVWFGKEDIVLLFPFSCRCNKYECCESKAKHTRYESSYMHRL